MIACQGYEGWSQATVTYPLMSEEVWEKNNKVAHRYGTIPGQLHKAVMMRLSPVEDVSCLVMCYLLIYLRAVISEHVYDDDVAPVFKLEYNKM